MSCTEQEIFDAFDQQLLTAAGIVVANVAFIGNAYQPEAETPYIATSMPVIDAKMLTVGQHGVYDWNGVYQVECNWPAGQGLNSLTQQRDAIRAVFGPNALTLTTSNGFLIRCQAPRVKPPFNDGAWLRGVVQVPWLLQEVV